QPRPALIIRRAAGRALRTGQPSRAASVAGCLGGAATSRVRSLNAPSRYSHALQQAPRLRASATRTRSPHTLAFLQGSVPVSERLATNGEGCFPATPRLRRRATSSSPWHNAAFLRGKLLLPVPFGTTGAV